MPETLEIDPGWAWDDKFPFAQAVRVGNVLYISGQTAMDPNGNLIGKGDMRAQSQRVFDNLAAVLEQAGGSMENIVKITAYLTDMSRFSQYNEVRARVFKGSRPASTSVQVSGLAFEGLWVEVEAVAYL